MEYFWTLALLLLIYSVGSAQVANGSKESVIGSSGEQPLVYEMANCHARCGQVSISGSFINKGCGCVESCLLNGNCCLNYIKECVQGQVTNPYNKMTFSRFWNLWKQGSEVGYIPTSATPKAKATQKITSQSNK